MRIAVVTVAPSPHLWGVLEALSAISGNSVEIWCRRRTVAGRGWEDEAKGLPWKALSLAEAVSGRVWATQALPDVLVLATSYLDPVTGALAFAARWRGLPTSVWWERPSRLSGALVRGARIWTIGAILDRVRGLVGMTEDTVEEYVSRYRYAKRTEWCPYHRDLGVLLGQSRSRTGGKSEPVFSVTAALTPRKAVDVAIRALALSKEPGRLVVVGDGPSRRELEALAARLLPGRVEFAGSVAYREVPRFLREASAFLFPSRHDGFGMAVMEAMAAGLPVLASNEVSAARQYVKNGVNGYLLPADDVEAWAEGIRRITREGFLNPGVPERVRASLAAYDVNVDAARLSRFLESL